MANWYVSSTKWTAVAAWTAVTSYNSGDYVRQLATPTVGNERVWKCTTAGISGAAEPSWTLTEGSTTNDGTAVWTEVTGIAAENEGGVIWAAPHARLRNAFSWGAAGDTFYLGDDHAATEAATITYSCPGTVASPCRVICVSDAAAPPTALATTAQEIVTGNTTLRWNSTHVYVYGVKFNAGTTNGDGTIGLVNGSGSVNAVFENCEFNLVGTGANGRFNVGASSTADATVTLINCISTFASTSQRMTFGVTKFKMHGGSIALTGSVPTIAFTQSSGSCAGTHCLVGVDLSAFNSGESLVDLAPNSNAAFLIQDCKLGASVAITTGTADGPGGISVRVVNSDSGDTNYRYAAHDYMGVETSETTIVRTGGASDGTTTVSGKIVTPATTTVFAPYRTYPVELWQETVGGAITATVEMVTDNVTVTDAEVWLEIEYLGTSGFPLGAFASDRVADPIFGTPANQTSSSETWTTTGLGTPIKQKLAVTFTPQEKGVFRAVVCVAKASLTMYFDPKVTVT